MSVWLNSAASWLTPRRLRAHATILAVCLWGACAVDFSVPGFFDRAGNIKFQDFLQFSISARLIAQGRAHELYNDQVLAQGIREIVGRESGVYLQYFYGPQLALPFIPLLPLSFLTQAEIWVTLSLLIYFLCVYLLFRSCPRLHSYPGLVALCAIAYPPLYHFFVRGHISVVLLACFTASCLAFLARREWLTGLALGLLVIKPQLLIPIALVLLLAQAWKILAGLIFSAVTQMAATLLYFGSPVMRLYFAMLLHSAIRPATTELTFSSIQMHSLRSFWDLLIPWPQAVGALYIVSSLVVVWIAASIWNSSSPPALRFSALLLASVLANPHIYIYDLLVLIPAFLMITDWLVGAVRIPFSSLISLLLYLSFLLPLFGPLARWTHIQLSVLAFAALLWLLWRCSSTLPTKSASAL